MHHHHFKHLLYIVLLALAVILLVILALRINTQRVGRQNEEKRASEEQMQKTAEVYFSPSYLDLTSQTASLAPQTVDVYVNAEEDGTTGVQFELEFDPEIITNLRISPPTGNESIFQNADYSVLFNDVDTRIGIATFAITIPPQAEPIKLTGSVATITFQVRRTNADSTQMSFLENTFVSTQGSTQSILNLAVPLTIQILR